MILVIIGIAIFLIILGCVLEVFFNTEFLSMVCAVCGAVMLLISVIVLISLCIDVSKLNVLDDMITMYQEENAKIENQIAETVKQYQQYETEIFTEVAPDSAITLVALYPELKADALVQSQIEVYLANSEKIKSLKETKINGKVYRWWLYFGG